MGDSVDAMAMSAGERMDEACSGDAVFTLVSVALHVFDRCYATGKLKPGKY